jgi:hypothetical protein
MNCRIINIISKSIVGIVFHSTSVWLAALQLNVRRSRMMFIFNIMIFNSRDIEMKEDGVVEANSNIHKN